ncbi:hypothetical protein [Actinoplanes sp. NBRC 103695]|uniref:hypothetical protein n=1 Tax=Actinoplanes sp. NBRC 103695 TaxID=3032202 RepID=UPI0024A0694C|nr:hypothetical protein [Actinoplanes sp. NBRC 103695]GLY97841.1 hypothetical protein Acsp02_50950 [Actinoplanes sp. NBRC 103695]
MTVAQTPPMGWNSWDCYGTTVTEAEVLANASFMAGHLLPYGWDTIVVDIQWYEPTARAGGYNAGAPLRLDELGRPYPRSTASRPRPTAPVSVRSPTGSAISACVSVCTSCAAFPAWPPTAAVVVPR